MEGLIDKHDRLNERKSDERIDRTMNGWMTK